MTFLKEILKKPTLIIFFSSILVFFNSWPAFILMRKGWFLQDSTAFSIAIALSAFFIMFVIPAVIIKFVLKKPLSDFGLLIPKNLLETVKLSAIILVIFLPVVFFLASKENFQQFYLIKHNFNWIFFLEILASCFYFFSEEFLFRGVLFFGLWDKLRFHTFWITGLLFALFHIAKPGEEILFAFFVGLSLSYLSLKTKSFLPAVVVHIILASALNIIVLIHSIT
ncbi:MAG: type II CAAX endopeptidase family protein [Candidatus Zambryskibacteria bacterium]|nr:type II CAAX endopeptidase family protein [Candidatus Zambryskibacteria bacterium]